MSWSVPDTSFLLLLTLVLARASAFFSVFPAFGGGAVPMRIKAGTAAALTLLIVAGLDLRPAMPTHWLALGLLVGREVLLGLLLGSIVNFVFMAAQFAGQVIGVQMGLAAATLFDPTMKETVQVSGRLYYLLAVLLFLSLDLHHAFLAGFGESFRLLPPGQASLNPAGFQHWAELTGRVLLLALRLSLPALGALLILDTALGFLARLVPQMNIFLVGFPLKIGLGIAVLALGVGAAVTVLKNALVELVPDFLSLMSWVR